VDLQAASPSGEYRLVGSRSLGNRLDKNLSPNQVAILRERGHDAEARRPQQQPCQRGPQDEGFRIALASIAIEKGPGSEVPSRPNCEPDFARRMSNPDVTTKAV
jgi:hypothetical protein